MIKKILLALCALIILTTLVFALGPKVSFAPVSAGPITLDYALSELDSIIHMQEIRIKDLKKDNEARVVWHDESIKQKTPYSVVYLHGFSSSQEEGDPIHENFAHRYGCNLYLSRLYDHGRSSDDSFDEVTPEQLMQSAKEAIAIGKLLGDKVILMSCSTGGTYSAYLATEDPAVHSMIMYSPNINVYDPMSAALLWPWGRQILNKMVGGEYVRQTYGEAQAAYWNATYNTDGLFALMAIIDQTMNEETFKKINIPVFLAYYYENEEKQDKVVSVARMLDFYHQIATPDNLKRKMAFPKAGRHVISADILSKDWEGVQIETFRFAEEVLGLEAVEE